MNLNISLVSDENVLKKIIKDVLLDLPEWFGIPESTQEYIDEGSKLPTFVADIDNEHIGFITLKKLNNDEVELYVLGIKRNITERVLAENLLMKPSIIVKQMILKELL